MNSKFRKLLDEAKKSSRVISRPATMEMAFGYKLSDPNLLGCLLELFFNFPHIDLYIDDFKVVCIPSNPNLSKKNIADFHFIFDLYSAIHEDLLAQNLIFHKVEDIREESSKVLKRVRLAYKNLSQRIDSYPDQTLIHDLVTALIAIGLATISFEKEDYMKMFSYKDMHSEAITYMKLKNENSSFEAISKAISVENKQKSVIANQARWQGHVAQQRRLYLDLDQQRQVKLGKKSSIKDTAMWIYTHHNPLELEYETIRNHLSKARKGIFDNKQK